jgi:hypothetical protein
MRITLRKMLAPTGAALGLAGLSLAGCGEERPPAIGPGVYPALAAADIVTIGEPGPQDVPFGQALVTYSQQLGSLHARDPDADARIFDAVRAMATVLERIPAAGAQPRLRSAASLMRAAVEAPDASIEDVKRALAAAATALLPLARSTYRESPEVGAHLRGFAGSVSAIDTSREPPDRATVVCALLRAERALSVMYAANVMPAAH